MPVIERPAPDDQDHRTARSLNLTVAGCDCRRCANLRDLATIAGAKFGREDEPRFGGGPHVLAAIDRVNAR